MKTIIAGSRTFTDYAVLLDAIAAAPWTITEVVSGTARGVDALGERYARENQLPLHRFAAQWDLYGKAAGPIRNSEMVRSAQALIALWDGRSRGTRNMIETARRSGLKVYVHKI
jgi:hypothetical protein